MKTTLLTFLICILFICQNFGQFSKDYVTGKIYTKTEVIDCFVIFEEEYSGSYIKYKLKKDDPKPLKIKTRDVIALTVISKEYERIHYKNESFLAIKLIKGNVSLYDHNYHPISVNASGQTTSSFNTVSTYYVSKGDTVVELKPLSFRKELKSILNGFPETDQMIDELKYSDIEFKLKRIIWKYNQLAEPKNH